MNDGEGAASPPPGPAGAPAGGGPRRFGVPPGVAGPAPGGFRAGVPTVPPPPGAAFAGAPGGFGAVPPPGMPPTGHLGGPDPWGTGHPLPPRRETRLLAGIPPAMGLGVILAGFPGILLVASALTQFIFSAMLSSVSDGPFRSNASSDIAGYGVFLLVVGVFWLGSTVYAAAGSSAGRIGMTVCVGCAMALFVLVGLASATNSAGAPVASVIMVSPGFYVLYAFWGPPARGMY